MAPNKPRESAKIEVKEMKSSGKLEAHEKEAQASDEKKKVAIKAKAGLDSHKEHEKQPQPRWK